MVVVQQEVRRLVPRGTANGMDAVSRLTEIFVDAGADLSAAGSLTASEVTNVFPLRAARRVQAAMARRENHIQSSATKPSVQVDQRKEKKRKRKRRNGRRKMGRGKRKKER